ncbi:RNA-binding RNA annealing protein [Neofusicoccum ribis]|uniref:RNA-binding RNA annealing protein n=1 Tax=Neofusicoccum ribis TaxID=45134 RepID=A0ABR3T5Q4_9PEZI
MSDKLNQSLDEILKANKRANRTRPGARRAAPGKGAATAAPIGGIKKNTKAPKAAAKPNIPTGPASKAHGDSKILVSNLSEGLEIYFSGSSQSHYAQMKTPYYGSIGVSEHSSEAAQHSILSNPKSHPIGYTITQGQSREPSHTSVGEGKVVQISSTWGQTSALALSGSSALEGSGIPSEAPAFETCAPGDCAKGFPKEYFAKSVGPVKKVLLTYGPNGQSRGVATVIFSKVTAAAEAAAAHNGLKVDNRPMRVEVIVGASDVPAPAPRKSLNERVQQPKPAAKAQPKPATAAKKEAAGKAGKKRRGKTVGGRPKPKTAEELDAEMQDYFDASTGAPADGDTAMATNGGAVQAVANGGDQMEDEVM